MSKTHKSAFSLQKFNFRFKFFFDQNLDFVLGKAGDISKAMKNMEIMRKLGVPVTSVTYTAILDYHAKRGATIACEEWFQKMRNRDLKTSNSISILNFTAGNLIFKIPKSFSLISLESQFETIKFEISDVENP